MAIVVVGGHSRKVGKTSVVSALIRGLPEYRWTAIKLSPHAHGHANRYVRDLVVTEESVFPYKLARLLHCKWIAPKPTNDTLRFLAAGSARAILVSFYDDDLSSAMKYLSPIIRSSPFTIIESNSIMQFLKPDFCLVVLKTDVLEFKGSARQILGKADAALIVDCGEPAPAWKESVHNTLGRVVQFRTADPMQIPRELVDLVKSRI